MASDAGGGPALLRAFRHIDDVIPGGERSYDCDDRLVREVLPIPLPSEWVTRIWPCLVADAGRVVVVADHWVEALGSLRLVDGGKNRAGRIGEAFNEYPQLVRWAT